MRAVEAVWRIESPRLIAGARRGSFATSASPRSSRRTRSSRRSSSGPSRACRTIRAPGSWPRRSTARSICCGAAPRSSASSEELAHELEQKQQRGGPDIDAAIDDYVGDDLLRLMFLTCHPVLSKEARTALTLRLLGGLTTDEIARAFLVAEPTVAQRIVRAKRTLAAAQVPFELPPRDELDAPARLRARGDLPRLQRGLRRHRGRRLDPPGAARGGAAARPHAGRASSRRSRRSMACWRSWRSRRPARARASGRAASRCSCSTRTAPAGTSS